MVTILVHRYHSWLVIVPTDKCILHSLSKTSLKWWRTWLKTMAKLIAEVWSQVLTDAVPAPKALGALQKNWQEILSAQRIKKFAVRLYLALISETTPIESYLHNCLNMGLTKMKSTGVWKWMKKSVRGLRTQKLQATKEYWEARERVFLREDGTTW